MRNIFSCCSVVCYCVTPWTAAPQLLCPSLSPWFCSNSCSLNQWCHPIISSLVIPFSSCPWSFPAFIFREMQSEITIPRTAEMKMPVAHLLTRMWSSRNVRCCPWWVQIVTSPLAKSLEGLLSQVWIYTLYDPALLSLDIQTYAHSCTQRHRLDCSR